MKRVAILGGGPAGAFAAQQLAATGLKVQLFDEKLAWEKPCGGGLTHKAYRQYPFLIENSTPKRMVTESVLAAPNAGAVTVAFPGAEGFGALATGGRGRPHYRGFGDQRQ